MNRWVITGVVIILVTLMVLPLIMAAGRKLRSYFSSLDDIVDKEDNNP